MMIGCKVVDGGDGDNDTGKTRGEEEKEEEACILLESEIVEEIAKDVLQKLNRVYVGDLDQEIAKYKQLATHQWRYFLRAPHAAGLFQNYQATLKHIDKLEMERHHRLLRTPPNMYTDADGHPEPVADSTCAHSIEKNVKNIVSLSTTIILRKFLKVPP
ncbi:hypothetical protein JHK85_023447 [Glycine max]|nr:hypothetical protein JHK85_023447 [Glycine max]